MQEALTLTESLFRKAALENIKSSEQLNQLIRVTSPHDWIILGGLWLLLFVAILWGIFGTIPTRVTGEGILLGSNTSIHDAVALEGSGRVASIQVNLGDRVAKDQILAYLDNPDLAKQVDTTQRYLKQLQEKYAKLSATSEDQIKQYEAQQKEQAEILERDTKDGKEQLAQISDLLKRKEELLKRGIVTRQDFLNTMNDYYAVKQRLEEYRNQAIEHQQELARVVEDWKRQLRDLDLKITDAQHQLDNLNNQLALSKAVRSPVPGIITHIEVAIGDNVKEGKSIASIADESKDLDAIVYIPAHDSPRIKYHARSLISPSTIKKEEFGSLEARVTSAASFPSTPQSMLAILHNQDLVTRFTQKGPPLAVRVKILRDPKSYSGYKWTSKKGPNQEITPGMIVTAEITVREQAPISLIIPMFKRLVGG